MQTAQAYKNLAAKLVFQNKKKEFSPPDSVVQIVAFAFTEEEAMVTNAIGFKPGTAKAIAKRLNRPLHEIEPVLKSLVDKVLIVNIPYKGVMYYSMLPLLPGIYESQILLNRDKDTAYTKEFARLFEEFYNELGEIVRPMLDGKEVHMMRIIPIEKSLRAQPELNVIALDTDKYSEMVDRNKSFAQVICPCRTTAELLGHGCDKPKDVCSGMGIVADMAIQKGLARRITKEEFIETKARAAEAGLVNVVDNLQDPLQVCSCCACCCVGLKLTSLHNLPSIMANSHFESALNSEKCNGCGVCVKWCPMSALSVADDKKLRIDYKRCIGCGVCMGKCSRKALLLQERKGYQPPPDNIVSHAIERYLQFKGYNKNGILPRATLGIGRLLSKYVQPKFSGPDYKPME